MPRDSLSLTVRVGREEYLCCIFGVFLDVLNEIAFSANVNIMSFEIIIYVNTEGAFGEIANVSL